MNDRKFSKRTVGTAKAAFRVIVTVGLAIAAALPLPGQEASGGTNSAAGPAATAYLDYRDVSFYCSQLNLRVSRRSAPFRKEPTLSRNNVTRGMLQLGGGASNEMAFAWDRNAGKLYLDLNRNLDLTDDPAGVFLKVVGSWPSYYQSFTNVHLPLRTPAGECETLMVLIFYGYGGLRCSATIQSFWQGKVTLQGVEWQMGLLPRGLEPPRAWEDGTLLLRPWSRHNESFSTYDDSLEAFPFSRELFVGNHAYQLQCADEVQGNAPKVRVQFTEQQPRLGELKITGDSVRRVTLEGGDYMVVIDRPAPVVKVPVGNYKRFKVCLKKGDVEAHLDARAQAAAGRISINAGTPAVLTAGGPLTNSVSISRQGRTLMLNYQLVGAAGGYQVSDPYRVHPPEFTVYQGDKKIGSGKFQYG
jgi:hypothetical protein